MTENATTEKTIGILQPGYLPWLGFFEQMCRSDIFVFLDDVQYEKGSWRNRNRIKTPHGLQWLTVPVLTKGQHFPLIREVRINNCIGWADKHIKSIAQHYTKAPYFKQYADDLFNVLRTPWNFLIDLDLALLDWLKKCLDIDTLTLLSSDLGVKGRRTERLIAIIQHLNGTIFYEGSAGRSYIEQTDFMNSGITIAYQDYRHPVYPQLYGDFISHASVIDLLFNCGPQSREILLWKKTSVQMEKA
jgi:hypothetical protein